MALEKSIVAFTPSSTAQFPICRAAQWIDGLALIRQVDGFDDYLSTSSALDTLALPVEAQWEMEISNESSARICEDHAKHRFSIDKYPAQATAIVRRVYLTFSHC